MAGGLSAPWGIPPNNRRLPGTPTNVRVLLGFSEAPLCFQPLWISYGATIYFYCHFFRETERKTSATLDKKPIGRAHIQSEQPSTRLVQFSCNQKKGEKRGGALLHYGRCSFLSQCLRREHAANFARKTYILFSSNRVYRQPRTSHSWNIKESTVMGETNFWSWKWHFFFCMGAHIAPL